LSLTFSNRLTPRRCRGRRKCRPRKLIFHATMTSTNGGNDSSSASSSSPQKNITKKGIRNLPLLEWEGHVKVLETLPQMQSAVDTILSLQNTTVLGFDTETRPCFRKGQWNPTALVQIATAECVYLFRICKLERSNFAPLIPLLESKRLIKCGVNIAQDVKELLKVQTFTPRSFHELSDMTRQLGYVPVGLRSLAALLLQGRVSKTAQMSNWEKPRLEQGEIKYAATDAWVGLELYRVVTEQQAVQNLPSLPAIDFDALAAKQEKKSKEKNERKKKGNNSNKSQKRKQSSQEDTRERPASSPVQGNKRRKRKPRQSTAK
jgi:ribonuclease D